LALIVHLSNRCVGPVTGQALEKALVWARYLESHARRIYSATLNPDMAAARELAKKLEHGHLGSTFTVREVYRKNWTGLDNKEDADAATEILCELGWLRPVQSEVSPIGRPPSQAFTVNPKICEGVVTLSDKTDNIPGTGVLSLLSPPVPPSNPIFEPPEPALAATPVAGGSAGVGDEPAENPDELLL
jgi:hypothetical protein